MGVLISTSCRLAKMDFFVVFTLALIAVAQIVSATVTLAIPTLTVGTVSLGTTGAAVAGGLLAAKALILKASLLNSHRRKRQAEACLPIDNPDILLLMAQNSNSQDCGRRFICELEASNDTNLSHDELLVKNVFSTSKSESAGSVEGFFREAGQLGITGGLKACEKAYASCPFDRKLLYQLFQASLKSQ